jgi:hypothetical protein
MEIKSSDLLTPNDPATPKTKKPWQTPRLTCETDTNSAQKVFLTNDTLFPDVVGPS